MIPTLAGLALPSWWRLAAGAAVVAAGIGAWLYVSHLRSDLDATKARAAVLDSARSKAVATLDTARRQHDHAMAALAEMEARQQTVASRLNRIKTEIAHAPADGCVGPAVRTVVDGLRQP